MARAAADGLVVEATRVSVVVELEGLADTINTGRAGPALLWAEAATMNWVENDLNGFAGALTAPLSGLALPRAGCQVVTELDRLARAENGNLSGFAAACLWVDVDDHRAIVVLVWEAAGMVVLMNVSRNDVDIPRRQLRVRIRKNIGDRRQGYKAYVTEVDHDDQKLRVVGDMCCWMERWFGMACTPSWSC